jgi:hypothetical protein
VRLHVLAVDVRDRGVHAPGRSEDCELLHGLGIALDRPRAATLGLQVPLERSEHGSMSLTVLMGVAPPCVAGKHTGRLPRGYVEAFPDAKFTIKNVIASGDWIVVEGTYSGTHKGPMPGPRPSFRRPGGG